ncbi:MAG: AMP-binding protein [Myxococcota bacterium]
MSRLEDPDVNVMIDGAGYSDLGALLIDCLLQFKSATALLEYRRKQEPLSLTYLQMSWAGDRMARQLQEHGVGEDARVAVVMSNQSRWLLSAYAVFFRGAILVPIDYKLSGREQIELLKHCRASHLIIEYDSYRTLPELPSLQTILVTEVPDGKKLHLESGAYSHPNSPVHIEKFAAQILYSEPLPMDQKPTRIPRQRSDPATFVYSSGTGGEPKCCILTHGNYLEQYSALSALFPMRTGDRYFSILPTNHAIDFMCGFIGPLAGGATVVHQRTLRPEFLKYTMREAAITHMSVVPMLLEAFERSIREQLDTASVVKESLFETLRALNWNLTRRRANRELSRRLLKPVHDALGGHLKLLICGGAFVEPKRAQFFYELGIPVIIGYGLTEACTVVTVNRSTPFRPDSVGAPIRGVEVEIRQAVDGVGEVWVRGPTMMQGYLDNPELTQETLQDGWLRTGDLGYLDASHHLHIKGRKKNMIVTSGGKNVYPEDVELAFRSLPCEEFCILASNFIWPLQNLKDPRLLLVVHRKQAGFDASFKQLNQRLAQHKRVQDILHWGHPLPRTASMKVKRGVLAKSIAKSMTEKDFITGMSTGPTKHLYGAQ